MFQKNLSQHPHRKLLHPSLLLGLMASQLTVNKRVARSLALTSHKRECTRRFPKGHKELDPVFALASTSVCDIGQFT